MTTLCLWLELVTLDRGLPSSSSSFLPLYHLFVVVVFFHPSLPLPSPFPPSPHPSSLLVLLVLFFSGPSGFEETEAVINNFVHFDIGTKRLYRLSTDGLLFSTGGEKGPLIFLLSGSEPISGLHPTTVPNISSATWWSSWVSPPLSLNAF